MNMKAGRIVFASIFVAAATVTGCGGGGGTQATPTGDSQRQEVVKVAGELDSLLGGSGKHRQFVFGIVSGGDTVAWRGDLPAKVGKP